MNKLLYISYFAPYDKVDHAGGKVHNFYVKKLQKEKDYDVTLLTMCYKRELENLDLKQYGIKHRLVVLDKTVFSKYMRMLVSGFSYYNPWDKYGKILLNFERFHLKQMIKRYAKKEEQPDIIILQWTQIILLMPFIKKLYPNAKIIAIEEDVIFLNFFRRMDLAKNSIQRYFAKYQYCNMQKRELRALQNADQVVVNNFKDAKLLQENGIEEKKIFTSSVYFENYHCVKRKEIKKDILFYGAMHRRENHISAMWFVKNVLPYLPEEFCFVIVGARPQSELLALQSDRVKVMGFVEDIAPYFASCFCLAAPLLLGAGIKVKILEAMSAGVPVLTNTIGIEGIGCKDRQEYWHCETAKEYMETIQWMESNIQETEKVAENGRKYIADHFNLESRYEALLKEWRDML